MKEANASASSKGKKIIPPSSPLFLHASDNPGAILTTIVINRENHDQWADAIRQSLMAKNKVEFIDGTVDKLVLLTVRQRVKHWWH